MGGSSTEASVSLTALHGHGHTQSKVPGPRLVSEWGAEQSRVKGGRAACASVGCRSAQLHASDTGDEAEFTFSMPGSEPSCPPGCHSALTGTILDFF